MRITSKSTPCRSVCSENFTPKACEELLNTILSHLIEGISQPIDSIGSLKIEAFKLNFKWYNEGNYLVLTQEGLRSIKFSIQGKWIQINPNLTKFDPSEEAKNDTEYFRRLNVFKLLSMVPGSFTLLLGKDLITLKELKEQLKIVPF